MGDTRGQLGGRFVIAGYDETRFGIAPHPITPEALQFPFFEIIGSPDTSHGEICWFLNSLDDVVVVLGGRGRRAKT